MIELVTVDHGYQNRSSTTEQYWKIDGFYYRCDHIGNYRYDVAKNRKMKSLPKTTKKEFFTVVSAINENDDRLKRLLK
jgi:hypothetical protein